MHGDEKSQFEAAYEVGGEGRVFLWVGKLGTNEIMPRERKT